MADEVRQTDIDQFKDHNLKLQEYFPYRLARLAEQVSLAVAEVYADRFALSRQEWRILAALGEQPRLPTKQIGRLTTLVASSAAAAIPRTGGSAS